MFTCPAAREGSPLVVDVMTELTECVALLLFQQKLGTRFLSLCAVLRCFFGSSTSQLTTTLAALLHVLNGGGRELEEMANRHTGLSTYATDTHSSAVVPDTWIAIDRSIA